MPDAYHAPREAILAELTETIERAERVLVEGDPTAAIALVVITLARFTMADELKDYQRDRARERAFAGELYRLAGTEGAALEPAERTRRLRVLAQWLDEGYDGPPNADVYAEGFTPPIERTP